MIFFAIYIGIYKDFYLLNFIAYTILYLAFHFKILEIFLHIIHMILSVSSDHIKLIYGYIIIYLSNSLGSFPLFSFLMILPVWYLYMLVIACMPFIQMKFVVEGIDTHSVSHLPIPMPFDRILFYHCSGASHMTTLDNGTVANLIQAEYSTSPCTIQLLS